MTEGFVRRPRLTPPSTPGGELNLQAPPEVPRPVPGTLLSRILPVVMVVAVIGMIALFVTMGGSAALQNPMTLLFPLMMLMSMGGMLVGGNRGGGKRAAELNEDRKDYFRYLVQARDEVKATGNAQLDALNWSHPDPLDLQAIIGEHRMWERRPSDDDFGHVRVGVGSQRLATHIVPPQIGLVDDIEPVSAVALRRFVRTHSIVHGLPIAVSFRRFPAINLEGSRPDTRQLARSMVMELATFHGPDHVKIAIVCSDPDNENWSWAKWLPHVQHPTYRDAVGSSRMMYGSVSELEKALENELVERGRFSRNTPATPGRPHLIILIDDGYVGGDERIVSDAGMDMVTILDLTAPRDGLAARRGLQLIVRGDTIGARNAIGIDDFAQTDSISIADAEVFARSMSRYRLATAAQIVSLGQDSTQTDPGLMSLLGIPDAAHIDPEVIWRSRSSRERLRVPVGISTTGVPVEIDIKEAAEGGMGPHGLCIGATGSGKSEFLRTLVLSLITTHSPDVLNLVLVDFKGGATFLGLDSAPHVSAVITNLEEELVLVDRMRDALSGEMNRRQELLRAAGNFANVGEYERARAAGAALDPLPALFIVVDEFSELLSQKADFAELFVAIGRLGRSLHMHLLLASQRLEEGKLRGLDSHLSYRIGLKTFSASESRSVLGVPDAYHLPNIPGSAYLKNSADAPVRFHSSYVSGEYERPLAQHNSTDAPSTRAGIQIFSAGYVPLSNTAAELPSGLPSLAELEQHITAKADRNPTAPTLLNTVVKRLEGHGRPAHEVWLPPLALSPTVDMLLGDHDWHTPPVAANLQFSIGVVDRPYDQRRDVLMFDLSGAAGHMAIVGAPQSGKSTALRTLILAAAATNSPSQVQFYLIDFGGGTLSSLAALPHVGGVVSRSDADGIRRTVAEVVSIMREREELFREWGVESMSEFRRRKTKLITEPETSDPVSADLHGDIFVIIDGWSTVHSDFEEVEDGVFALINNGLSYGVHVVISATRWAEIRPSAKDLIGSRLELKLGDPVDSEMDRHTAHNVPAGRPGRGLTQESLHLLVGLPRLDANSATDTLPDGVRGAVETLRGIYGDATAPKVRRLHEISDTELHQQLSQRGVILEPWQVPLGLNESELAPVILDFKKQPHFMLFADMESGKTTALRTIINNLVSSGTATETKIVLVDYRRTLLGVVDSDHLAGYATSEKTLIPMINQLHEYFESRIPTESVTQQQLRDRSWWTGPEIFIIVDDYDLVATSTNPLVALVDLLAQARDVGLHLIVTRRSGGISRALYDPVLGRLKDLASDMLLMSGDPDEGYITGRTRMERMPAGRGRLISRDLGQQLIQVSRSPE